MLEPAEDATELATLEATELIELATLERTELTELTELATLERDELTELLTTELLMELELERTLELLTRLEEVAQFDLTPNGAGWLLQVLREIQLLLFS